jgi:hypothetical protein
VSAIPAEKVIGQHRVPAACGLKLRFADPGSASLKSPNCPFLFHSRAPR